MQMARRVLLRMQGINPDELDEELERMDSAKHMREAEKAEAERKARKRYFEARRRLGGGR